MNSEELEQSLKAEFESHLKNVVAEMRQELADLQGKMQSDFERHRAQIDEMMIGLSSSLDSKGELHSGFSSLVAEHLRQARDEGAAVAATAFAEAEKMAEPVVEVVPANYSGLRDAIVDISSHDSQSSILRSLVDHASDFAPRGAFFIIKNEHLAGWKAFGEGADDLEDAIRDIHFPMSAGSMLGDASDARETMHGPSSEGDGAFLDPLGFGRPEKMYAIPLVARGRGVAVLYADHGSSGGDVNVEALDSLVKVAGMTVELLAAAVPQPAAVQESAPEQEAAPAQEESFTFSDSVSIQGGFPPEVQTYDEPVAEYHEPVAEYQETVAEYREPVAEYQEPVAEYQQPVEEFHEPVAEYVAEPSFEPQSETQFEPQPQFEDAGVEEHSFHSEPEPEPEPVSEYQFETTTQFEPEVTHEPETVAVEPEPVYETMEPAVVFDRAEEVVPEVVEPEPVQEPSPFEHTVEPFEPAAPIGAGGVTVAEASVVAPGMPKARLSDRHVDLPIEVPEEERRLHNDARRFARLLVSEIKLYNEKKVLEGRQAHDLYERLREAIDRSREMYDKRVQPPVAAKFDYFHYELVNSLAEGEAGRLGGGYPGATI